MGIKEFFSFSKGKAAIFAILFILGFIDYLTGIYSNILPLGWTIILAYILLLPAIFMANSNVWSAILSLIAVVIYQWILACILGWVMTKFKGKRTQSKIKNQKKKY